MIQLPTEDNDEDSGSETAQSVVKRTPAQASLLSEQQLERILARVPPIFTLPKPKTRCPYTNESRTGLLELIAPCSRNNFKPPVKAIYKRAHKYAQRGQWLIPAENLFRYLLGLAEGSTEEYLKTAQARTEAKENKRAVSSTASNPPN